MVLVLEDEGREFQNVFSKLSHRLKKNSLLLVSERHIFMYRQYRSIIFFPDLEQLVFN